MAQSQNGVLQKDDNGYPVMGGTSSSDDNTIINAAFDPITRRLLTDAATRGSVTSISVVTANGVSGSVANPTTTPAITLVLGAITPSTVNGVTLSGSSTPTLTVTGTTTVSGANTGDQPLFKTISVSGQSNIVADSPVDTLTLVGANGLVITTDAFSDTITLTAPTIPTTGVLWEVLGTGDGSTTVFTAIHSPNWITIAGQTVVNGGGVTLSGTNNLTVTFDSAPTLGQPLLNFYNAYVTLAPGSGGGSFLGLLGDLTS